MQAPWLSFAELRRDHPDVTMATFERTRSSLLARWQSDLASAGRRLRRGGLQAEDRVVAWSYLMLASGLPQRDLGRAAVEAALGPQWANALFGEMTPPKQEARRSLRENHRR